MAEAADGQTALKMVKRYSPDLVPMGITTPKLVGIEGTRQILSTSPGAKVMALSVQSDKRLVGEVLRVGAFGYILNESAPEEIIQGISAFFPTVDPKGLIIPG